MIQKKLDMFAKVEKHPVKPFNLNKVFPTGILQKFATFLRPEEIAILERLNRAAQIAFSNEQIWRTVCFIGCSSDGEIQKPEEGYKKRFKKLASISFGAYEYKKFFDVKVIQPFYPKSFFDVSLVGKKIILMVKDESLSSISHIISSPKEGVGGTLKLKKSIKNKADKLVVSKTYWVMFGSMIGMGLSIPGQNKLVFSKGCQLSTMLESVMILASSWITTWKNHWDYDRYVRCQDGEIYKEKEGVFLDPYYVCPTKTDKIEGNVISVSHFTNKTKMIGVIPVLK